MSNYTIFISDLHLEPARPDITELFFAFLKNQAAHADALYILGDFFEVWIGDDDVSEFNKSIKQALKNLSDQGIPVFFMRGNRDFLIGKKFAQETGCQLIPDPTLINLYGKPTLLTHGDALCTLDIKHLQFRKYAHNPNYYRFFLMLPLWLRTWIARKIRNKSQRHTRTISYEVMDVTDSEVIRIMELYQTQQLIHGHTHKPAIHPISVNSHPASRIVLGSWHEHGNALVYHEDGNNDLITF